MHRSTIVATALGGLASTLLGSGLLAVVVDSAASEGNVIQSSTLATPPADLRAGIIEEDDPCDATTTTDDATFEAVIGETAFTPSPGEQVSSQRICLYNAGASDGWANLRFANVFSREKNTVDGVCDNAEASPQGGNDTTCGVDDPGELPPILRFSVEYPSEPCPTGCTVVPPATYLFEDGATGPVLLKKIGTGEGISFHLNFRVTCCDETDQQRTQAAQTDFLQWDIRFALDDQEPAQ